MSLPTGLRIWELRAKRGCKHVIIYRGIFADDVQWQVCPPERINGPVRWYAGPSKSAMKPMTDWMDGWQ